MGFWDSARFGAEYLVMSFFRFAQFALGITVCGLYGVDLHNAAVQGKYQDGKWVGRFLCSCFSASHEGLGALGGRIAGTQREIEEC